MNNRQKAFLKSLLKNIEIARDEQSSILFAIKGGGLEEAEYIDHIQDLQHYINAAQRMVMKYTAAHGKGSKMIAAEAIAHQVSEN